MGIVAGGNIHTVADLKGELIELSANTPVTMLLKLELAKHDMFFHDREVWKIDGATRSLPVPINGRNEITLPDGSPQRVGNGVSLAALRRVTTAPRG